jgi:SAM-dependent methyltransferase
VSNGRVEFSNEKYLSGRERLQPFKLKMLELFTAAFQGRVLDIGCGSGVVSGLLRDCGNEVYGLDVSPVAIAKYRDNGFHGVVTTAEHTLPFKDGVFDAVWMSEVIEHIVGYEQLIMEVARVLKPGGRLYLTTPNSVFYGYRLMVLIGRCPTELQHPFHLRYFSPRFLSRSLARGGFKIEKRFGQNVYAMVPSIVLRLLRRISAAHAEKLENFLQTCGFKKAEGLIHGDKWLFYRFSSLFNGFFSNVIMLVARNQGNQPAPQVTRRP